MTSALRLICVKFCGLGLLAFLAPAAAAWPHDLAADWLPPTPTEGKRFRVAAGEPLRVALVASAREAPGATVSIEASGIPSGATFRTTAGNPAGATFRWIPSSRQAGRTFSVTFTADPDDAEVAAAKRHVAIEVVRSVARAFTLSSREAETYRYAFVMRRTVARSAPAPTARPVAKLTC